MDKGPAIIDVSNYLQDSSSKQALDDCISVADTLKKTSCLIIRDPRVTEADNFNFLDMMERYYSQAHEKKMLDVRPELSHQLGATPEHTEVPRDHLERIKNLAEDHSAHVPTGADKKWRYFWRIGSRPEATKFPELNAPPVVPDGFPDWTQVMDKWGNLMVQSVRTVAEMTAVGLGLPSNTFLNMLEGGPHLLAPTGSDLGEHAQLHTIFAGFHYDLNFLTIHGKSRFPGLYIWLRDGTRVLVRVPDGCLLIQAGKQLEWVTAGEITAGFHEVVVTKETLASVEKAKDEGKCLWRVSSTLFAHVASDKSLAPLSKFASNEKVEDYPSILAGDQVREELAHIKLGSNE